jgi:hypothetical protein
MRIRCPVCLQPVDGVEKEDEWVQCSTCGTTFKKW